MFVLLSGQTSGINAERNKWDFLLYLKRVAFFKGAAFKPPPRRSEEEGVVYIRLVQASDTLLQANSAASLSLARLRSRFLHL